MGIRDVIEDNRLRLHEVDVSDIVYSTERSVIQGAVAHAMMHQWLLGCEGVIVDPCIPREIGPYKVFPNKVSGYDVTNHGITVLEFDGMYYHENTPFVTESKSGKLGGYFRKVERALLISKALYENTDTELFLFCPLSPTQKRTVSHFEQMYPGLQLIDFKYSSSELTDLVTSLLER